MPEQELVGYLIDKMAQRGHSASNASVSRTKPSQTSFIRRQDKRKDAEMILQTTAKNPMTGVQRDRTVMMTREPVELEDTSIGKPVALQSLPSRYTPPAPVASGPTPAPRKSKRQWIQVINAPGPPPVTSQTTPQMTPAIFQIGPGGIVFPTGWSMESKPPAKQVKNPTKVPSSPKTRYDGVKSIKVRNTPFDLVRRARSEATLPSRSSQNFSKVKYKSSLLTIPKTVRDEIYRLAFVAGHDVLICGCGLCKWSSSLQPGITRVCRQLREEGLPMFYSENKFVILEGFRTNAQAPRWLRMLTTSSRNMIKQVEISTQDIAGAVCMMATLGFQMSHRLKREQHMAVMNDLRDTVIWLTFKPIRPSGEYGLPDIPRVSVWTEAEESDTSTIRAGSARRPSPASISTSVLSLNTDDANEDVIRQGTVARRARLVKISDDPEDLDSIEKATFRRDDAYSQQRAVWRPNMRFSIGEEMIRRVKGS